MRRVIAALGVCCLAVTACGTRSETPRGAPAPSWPPHSPQAVTMRAVDDLLHSVAVPPGSRLATPAEAAGLEPISTSTGTGFVDHHTAYVVPLSQSDTIGWYHSHPPDGTRASGSSSSSNGATSTSGLTFDAPRTDSYVGLEAQVNVSSTGTDSATVRVDAQAVWLPRRGPSDMIPLAETSVRVARYVGGGPPVVATLTGSVVAHLARVVNRLPTPAGGTYNCPNDNGDHDVLVFHGRGPDRTVGASVSGCGFVAIRVHGHLRKPELWGGAALDRAVRRALAAR
jgi:hypothetical protein